MPTPDAFEPVSGASSTPLPPSHQQCPDRRTGSRCIVLIGAILVAFGGCGDGARTGDASLGRTCPEFTFPYVPGQAVRGTCSEPFTIFEGHVTSAVPRNDIDVCTASIIDETGHYLLDEVPLTLLLGADAYGNPLLIQGCLRGQTAQAVGNFTYKTKGTTGLLTFRINAFDEGGNLLQSGMFDAHAAVYPPAVPLDVTPGELDAPLSEDHPWPADGAGDQFATDATTLEASLPVDVSARLVDAANVVDTNLAATLDGTAADKPEEISTGSDGGSDSIEGEIGAPLPSAVDAAVLDMEPG